MCDTKDLFPSHWKLRYHGQTRPSVVTIISRYLFTTLQLCTSKIDPPHDWAYPFLEDVASRRQHRGPQCRRVINCHPFRDAAPVGSPSLDFVSGTFFSCNIGYKFNPTSGSRPSRICFWAHPDLLEHNPLDYPNNGWISTRIRCQSPVLFRRG